MGFGTCAHASQGITLKRIILSEDVYRRLLGAKSKKESLSDVMDRVLSDRPKPSSFGGMFADDKEFSLLEEDVRRVKTATSPRTNRA